MTRQQKRRQRQRLWQAAMAEIKANRTAKKRKRNEARRDRRKRVNRGLATTQPAYHEEMRLAREADKAANQVILATQAKKKAEAKEAKRLERRKAVQAAEASKPKRAAKRLNRFKRKASNGSLINRRPTKKVRQPDIQKAAA